MNTQKKPTIVWEDIRLSYGSTPCTTSGGIAFGGNILFNRCGGKFYVPLSDNEKTETCLRSLGTIGEKIVREIAKILGIDEIRIESNYEIRISFQGVYRWKERRVHILNAIQKILNDFGYNFAKKTAKWKGEAHRPSNGLLDA